LEFKSLLGVLMAQVGVPKLPRHAQGDRQRSEQARRPTPRHAQGTARPPRTPQHFHRSRVGEAHELLRRSFKSQPRTTPHRGTVDQGLAVPETAGLWFLVAEKLIDHPLAFSDLLRRLYGLLRQRGGRFDLFDAGSGGAGAQTGDSVSAAAGADGSTSARGSWVICSSGACSTA
jgi:hypothetical protein